MKTQKGFAPLLLLLLLGVGLILGIYLVQKTQIFNSHAGGSGIFFDKPDGTALPMIDGVAQSTTAVVRVRAVSDLGPPANTVSAPSGTHYTVAYRIGESPSDLAYGADQPYTTEPAIFLYTFKDPSPGKKFLFVQFTDNTGKTDQLSAQIMITGGSSYRRVFVTSSTYDGNLGGLTGADSLCQTAATNANLGGTWKAWLSDTTASASARLEHSSDPYKLLNGTTIADNWADLTSGLIKNPINITEHGVTLPVSQDQNDSLVWTNTNNNGQIGRTDNPYTCQSWNSNNSSLFGGYGVLTSTQYWSRSNFTVSCTNKVHLYCIDQTASTSPTASTPPASGSATLSLQPTTSQVGLGCTVPVVVSLNTGNSDTDGTDALIHFDPSIFSISASDISKGTIYKDYPALGVDQNQSIIALSGVAVPPYNSHGAEGIYAKFNLHVNPNAPVGSTTKLAFDFDPNNPTKTTDSNVVLHGATIDILRQVNNATFTVGGPSCLPTPTVVPSPSTISTTEIDDSFNRTSISGLGVTDTGQAWQTLRSNFAIINGQAAATSACPAPGYAVVDTGNTNGDISVTLAKNVQDARIPFRVVDANNNYLVERDGWGYHIEKTVNGQRTGITPRQHNATFKDGDRVRVLYSGANIQVFVNGSLLLNVNDTSGPLGTKAGIGTWCDTTMRFDDFHYVPVGPVQSPIPVVSVTNTPTNPLDVVTNPIKTLLQNPQPAPTSGAPTAQSTSILSPILQFIRSLGLLK